MCINRIWHLIIKSLIYLKTQQMYPSIYLCRHIYLSIWWKLFLSIYYDTYLHGNGLFLLDIYRLYMTLGEITSKHRGGVCTTLGRWRFIGLRIWSGLSWFQWQSVEVSLDRHPRASAAVPQALTLLGGARFITWRLSYPFLEECRWGPMHFWECRACVGYDAAYGPT